jgi:hypothetical protein
MELYRAARLRDWAFRCDNYAVCSMQEARVILLFANIYMPVLVLASPAERAEGRHLTLAGYLTYLSTKATIDVHTYDQAPDGAGEYVLPIAMDAGRTVDLFRSPTVGP